MTEHIPRTHPRKSVTFSVVNSAIKGNSTDEKEKPQPKLMLVKIDAEKQKRILSIKRKMTRVKEAAKKCKKYMKKRNSDRADEAESMQQSLMESKRLAQKCITCLKSKDLCTHISNRCYLGCFSIKISCCR